MEKVYCLGDAYNGEGVIKALENAGGRNAYNFKGDDTLKVYYITNDGFIQIEHYGTQMAMIIKECFTKLDPVPVQKQLPKNLTDEFKKCLTNSSLVRETDATTMHTLSMLLNMRDIYNEAWTPDWKLSDKKYCITCIGGEIRREYLVTRSTPLAFKDVETRDEFYFNFKEEIEVCKHLL